MCECVSVSVCVRVSASAHPFLFGALELRKAPWKFSNGGAERYAVTELRWSLLVQPNSWLGLSRRSSPASVNPL